VSVFVPSRGTVRVYAAPAAPLKVMVAVLARAVGAA
jgi:hypothetical protein